MAKAAHYTARELAKFRGLSSRQVEREFHQIFRQSPQKWLDKLRLREAQQLLLSGQLVKIVAFDLGYKQSSHFCRQFKAQNNLTPSQFVAASRAEESCRWRITNVAGG